MTLTKSTARGVRVTLGATVISGSAQTIALVVLARLLSPADFGLYAGSMVIFSLIQRLVFSNVESGIVLQGSTGEIRPGDWSAYFWLAVLLATCSAAIVMIAISLIPVSQSFRTVVQGMALGLPMFGVALVARGKLRREMSFGRLAVIDLTGQVLGLNTVTIVAACEGYGAMSLVYGYVSQAALQLVLAYVFAGFRPRRANLRAAGPLVNTALQLLGTSALEVVHGKVTPTFVGGALGASALGIYSRADSLIQLPPQLLSTAMTKVLYSSFRLVADDVKRLRTGCRSLVQLATSLLLPLCCGMAAASDELVRVLLGLRWMKAAALAPWIALGAAFAVTGHLLAIMNEAVGRLGAKFVIQGFTTLAMVIAFVAAVRMGLVYCAMAYGVGGAVFLLGQVWLSGTVLEMKPISILRWCWPGMLAGGIEYGVVRCVRLLLITHSPVTRLVAEIAACAATLVLFYRAAFPGLFGQMLRMSGLGRWADGPATYQQ